MDDLKRQADQLGDLIDDLGTKLKIRELKEELKILEIKSQAPDFWQDSLSAQQTMKQIARLETKIKPWQNLNNDLADAISMLGLKDPSLNDELSQQIDQIDQKLTELKSNLKFSGPYDDHDAIINIYAGAGGTDAQDWTQMLFRMYVRFCDKKGWRTKVIDESPGDEAGLKSVTVSVEGEYAYGQLKGEHGVHRLVRLSPFNADNLRQTSFAKVEVVPSIDQPSELEIDEKDLKIDVYRSGGHGGQSVNTTDSAVRITHLPTGISVAIQNERSQLQNKEVAMTILRSKLVQLQLEQHNEKLSELKGPNQSAEWGNQIRSYVLHPYKQVKDLRTKYETSNTSAVLDGDLEAFTDAYLEKTTSLP